MFKGFPVLEKMVAVGMDVSEVEKAALVAAKICGGSTGITIQFEALGNIWWWKPTLDSYSAVSTGLN